MKTTEIVLLSVKNAIESMDKIILEYFESSVCSDKTALFIIQEIFNKAKPNFLQNLKAERVQNKIAPQVEEFYNTNLKVCPECGSEYNRFCNCKAQERI